MLMEQIILNIWPYFFLYLLRKSSSAHVDSLLDYLCILPWSVQISFDGETVNRMGYEEIS
jgi:hypothetical protein